MLPLLIRVELGAMAMKGQLNITEALPSDCLVSYSGHLLGESYLFAEVQLMYPAAPVNWANHILVFFQCFNLNF